MSKYCPNCGRELPDEAMFCDNCGTRIPSGNTDNRFVKSSHSKKKKKNAGSFLGKLMITAIVIFALLFVGMILWNKLYYHPGMLPDPTAEPAAAYTPATTVAAQIEESKAEEQTPEQVDDIPQGIPSPDGDPTFEEFTFYDTILETGVPEDAFMMSAGMTGGQWKYCLIFNYYPEQGERFDEVGLAELTLTGDSAVLKLHPQLERYSDEVYRVDEAEIGYADFTGTWDDDQISLQGNNSTVTFWPYYETDGKQYVLGAIVNNEGNLGHLILVRP